MGKLVMIEGNGTVITPTRGKRVHRFRHFEHSGSIFFLRPEFALWRNLLFRGCAFDHEISLRVYYLFKDYN
jgi:hypothetical protein